MQTRCRAILELKKKTLNKKFVTEIFFHSKTVFQLKKSFKVFLLKKSLKI